MNKTELMIERHKAFMEEDSHIDTCTIEELVTYAEKFDLHADVSESTSPIYVDRVARIRTRLTDADVDPDTIRNEYMDSLRTSI
jgi:hypothetical protein